MTNAEARQAHGAPADLELAHRLADHADAIASRHFAAGGIAWQTKSDGSPVTAVDREWGTLIALAEGDAVSLGVVTAAACQTRWWATRGSGAWSTSLPMDHTAAPTRLAVTTATDLPDAAIGIWPPPARLNTRDRQRAANLAAQARTTLPALDWHRTPPPTTTIRKPSTGSGTCHGALLVATGKLDAFLLQGAGPWDIAALIPIVEEAGGSYSDLSDDQHGDTRTALFSTPALHHQILDITAWTT
jgi:histidinol-phosphatase